MGSLFTKEHIEMANKYRERCTISLVIKEMQSELVP